MHIFLNSTIYVLYLLLVYVKYEHILSLAFLGSHLLFKAVFFSYQFSDQYMNWCWFAGARWGEKPLV